MIQWYFFMNGYPFVKLRIINNVIMNRCIAKKNTKTLNQYAENIFIILVITEVYENEYTKHITSFKS